ncbi:uncharacterized protein TOT_010001249 [Theileria orientalis strain Shintoku]|uniref:Signal peptidase complex subunit 1 n=1 Tax=Theileria orientalis strain Shintoku TaxID=869250 RepID=J4D5E7_THEOR|nr:uncharacterized protein TOT_010001249 [Theileria orientalis strain Shintoku]PVC52709.1 hypothetical protein MACL_00000576 [Theileria orientalis]BAM38910.1 uncharacterized protein TOT_010001249 [Theileria orientalis strain Shintoku]|eukprot:XP_009689211.1 uncharacterized protein TOT_010001249 [Theileria orientalis strain Shintoku]
MSLMNDIEDIFDDAVVDFHGQLHSTVAMWVITSLFGLVGFGVGYYLKSFAHTVKFILAGTGLSLLVCALPWPIYARHKIKWKEESSTRRSPRSSPRNEYKGQS